MKNLPHDFQKSDCKKVAKYFHLGQSGGRCVATEKYLVYLASANKLRYDG